MNELYKNENGDHYHRCEWCGRLEVCSDTCLDGGPYDPYGKEEVMSDGVLPGGYCDSDCYNHRRQRGCCYHELRK